MQSRRIHTRRNQRNVTMLINYNPDETNNVQDVNRREDVRIETTIETSPARIQIADRQFDFVNIRALFENNSSIGRNNLNVIVFKQEQIAETVIEQNEIKPNDTRVLKTETTIVKQKNKDKIGEDAKNDHLNDPHHQEGANDKKDKQLIKDHLYHKESVIDNKEERTIEDLKNNSHNQESIIDKKGEQLIQDLMNDPDNQEGARDKDTNYDQHEDKQKRMFPFNNLKIYWENIKKNK